MGKARDGYTRDLARGGKNFNPSHSSSRNNRRLDQSTRPPDGSLESGRAAVLLSIFLRSIGLPGPQTLLSLKLNRL